MEVLRESKRRRSKAPAVPGPLRRSARRLAQQLAENQQSTTVSDLSDLHVDATENHQSPVVFNLTDPYSAAMDDMPLKDLFPNMKVRKRSQSKKVEASDAPSPMDTGSGSKKVEGSDDPSPMDTRSGSKKVEASDTPSHMDTGSGDSDRSKLTESFVVALTSEVSRGEQDQCQSMKADSEMGDSDLMENALANQGLGLVSDGLAVNPDLKDSETKLNLLQMENNPSKEQNESQSETAEAPPKRIKIEPVMVKCKDAGYQNEASDQAERVPTSQPTGAPLIIGALDSGSNVVVDMAVKNQDPDNMAVEGEAVCVESSPIRELNLTKGIVGASDIKHIGSAQGKGEELDKAPQKEESASLPPVLSLDEFVGSKKPKGSKVPIQSDDLDLKLGLVGVKLEPGIVPNDAVSLPAPSGSKDKAPKKLLGSPKRKPLESGSIKNGTLPQKERKAERKVNEKLWEGSFRLSGCQISPVLALYKRGGDGVEIHSWPKLIEIKGRVRLDALEKFLQELRQARTRAVMVVSFRVDEGDTDRGASITALKEAANYYQRGERVGYAEPVPGYELYLFPGGGTSLKLLVQHGYLGNDQIVPEEEGILIGFVVCRRSTGLTSTAHKSSSSSHYYNANRHALSAQLDSPTRPNEVQWTGSVVATRKTTPLPLPVPSKEIDCGNSLHQMAYSLTGSASIFLQDQDHKSGKVSSDGSEKSHRVEDADEDLPPGFGPKAMATAKHTNLEDDDDDLPEYDFSALNSASISSSVKPPNVVKLPNVVPLSRPPALSSQPETPLPYGQLNPTGPPPSLLARPIAPPVHGLLEQVRPLNPVSSQVSQPVNFHAMGLRPPPGPPGGPPPFAIFPLKPHLPGDGAFAVRMPSTAPVPAPPLPHAENAAAIHDQRTRPLLQGQPVSQGAAQIKEGSKGSSLWDDDDMPEWRPPEVSLLENKQILPRPPAVSNMEPGPAGGPSRGTTPSRSGGLPGLPLRPAVPRQGEGRGILQAPSPAMLPSSSNRGPVPIARLEKIASDRGPSTNKPMDVRGFKGGK